jgi:hypothetical protein
MKVISLVPEYQNIEHTIVFLTHTATSQGPTAMSDNLPCAQDRQNMAVEKYSCDHYRQNCSRAKNSVDQCFEHFQALAKTGYPVFRSWV